MDKNIFLAKKTAKVKPKVKVNNVDALIGLVDKHNDYINANDLEDQTINYEDYFNKNKPEFIEGKQDIGEEINYIQNQLWKIQKDKRYVPDYEDMKLMGDDEFNNLLYSEGRSKESRKDREVYDEFSDDIFTKQLDDAIANEPQPRRRPSA